MLQLGKRSIKIKQRRERRKSEGERSRMVQEEKIYYFNIYLRKGRDKNKIMACDAKIACKKKYGRCIQTQTQMKWATSWPIKITQT